MVEDLSVLMVVVVLVVVGVRVVVEVLLLVVHLVIIMIMIIVMVRMIVVMTRKKIAVVIKMMAMMSMMTMIMTMKHLPHLETHRVLMGGVVLMLVLKLLHVLVFLKTKLSSIFRTENLRKRDCEQSKSIECSTSSSGSSSFDSRGRKPAWRT